MLALQARFGFLVGQLTGTRAGPRGAAVSQSPALKRSKGL